MAEDNVSPEFARWFGRIEATLEQNRRDQRREHEELKKTVSDLANRVTEHDKMIADARERARKSNENLSEHAARTVATETAIRSHLGKVEGQLLRLEMSTAAQDVELGEQTKLLKFIRAVTPIITAVAGAVGAAAASYYAHAEVTARMLGGH